MLYGIEDTGCLWDNPWKKARKKKHFRKCYQKIAGTSSCCCFFFQDESIATAKMPRREGDGWFGDLNSVFLNPTIVWNPWWQICIMYLHMHAWFFRVDWGEKRQKSLVVFSLFLSPHPPTPDEEGESCNYCSIWVMLSVKAVTVPMPVEFGSIKCTKALTHLFSCVYNCS